MKFLKINKKIVENNKGSKQALCYFQVPTKSNVKKAWLCKGDCEALTLQHLIAFQNKSKRFLQMMFLENDFQKLF
jgi:hypothetical protein